MNPQWLVLREKYPKFVYRSFDYKLQNDQLLLHFNYEIAGLDNFEHELILRDIDESNFDKLDKVALDNLIFHTGLIMSLSYWKLTCSKEFIVEAGSVLKEGLKWFSDLFYKGLGQYFYENNIDFKAKDFINFSFEGKKFLNIAKVRSTKVLVPFSGGKDSTVTLELLRKHFKTGLFLVYPQTSAGYKIAESTKLSLVSVESKIDHKLLSLNEQGFLNGHTPYSSYLMMVSVLAAYVFGYGYVAYSNERSSNENNTSYLGEKINHAYSKSWEYEKLFSSYNKHFLSNVEVFSFLRPLFDVQISRIFSNFTQYYDKIRSCNVGQKEGIWCGKCAKCLSTYILLSPFIQKEIINEMFGKDLFSDVNLTILMDSLIDQDLIKPFECVGTKAELRSALSYFSQKTKANPPQLIQHYDKKYINRSGDRLEVLLKSWNSDNYLSQKFEEILKQYL